MNRDEPIRTVIVNDRDAEALRSAAERIGWNFFLLEGDGTE